MTFHDVSYFVAGIANVIASLALAGTLLFVGFHNRLNQILALALTLLGVGNAGFLATFAFGLTSPELVGLGGLARACVTADPYAFLAFALVYRDHFLGSRTARLGLPLVGAVGALHVGAEIANVIPALVDLGRAAISGAATAIVATVLVLDAARTTSARRRRGLLIGALGFAFPSVAIALHGLVPEVMGSVWTLRNVVYLLGLLPLAYACARLVRAARQPEVRPDARSFFAALSLAPASVLFLGALVAFAPLEVAFYSMGTIMSAWGVVRVALVGYAVLRVELFGVDASVKRGVSRGTVAAVFLLVFFVAAQLAQNLLSDALGWAIGGAAAGALLFAIAPIQKMAERIASTAVPGVREPGAMTSDDRLAFYRDQARAAWEDGVLSRDERRLLDVTRDRLGISAEDAARIEREVSAS